jgi:hypothetical protein
MLLPFSLLFAGVAVEREKVTPAVGIVFNNDKKIYNLSGFYFVIEADDI